LRYYDFSAAIPGKRYKTIYEPGPSISDKFSMHVQKRHLV